MMMDFTNRVAIITGAGGGLGRHHALALAARGARVVVNDIGGQSGGASTVSRAAETVAEEIRGRGGEAIASGASVSDGRAVETMVAETMAKWGRIDILVNNAGILRDSSFSKMTLGQFRLVLDVHLIGAFNCTKAVWEIMRSQNYGRIAMTTSSSGLFGNFGQANYGAAKMGLVGLMQTLSIEGRKYDIRVNCLAPTAATQMTEHILPSEALAALDPSLVSPGLLHLVSEDAPTRMILCAGAGSFERSYITLTHGAHIGSSSDAAERVASSIDRISDRAGETIPQSAVDQGQLELGKLTSPSVFERLSE